MKKEMHILSLVLLAGLWISSSAQDFELEPDMDGILVPDTPLIAPPNVFSFGLPKLSSRAIVGWQEVPGAYSYNVRIYKSDRGLFQEIRDVAGPVLNITNLEGSTQYMATVTTVFHDLITDTFLESPESQPSAFTTVKACTGGRVYVECTAHCISTCDDPDPVCSRICSSGCGCPNSAPIWYQETCIPRPLCPPVEVTLIRPTNLQVFSSDETDDVVVVWDAIENAAGYTVEVRAADNPDTVIQTLTTSEQPIVSVQGLSRGVTYVFSVTVNNEIDDDTDDESGERNLSLPPPNIEASNITSNGFRVKWSTQNGAVRYAFALYDENGTVLLYSDDKIAGNIVDIDGLASGTTYRYTVASARTQEKPKAFMPLQEVKTEGESVNTDMFYSAIIVTVPLPMTTTPQPPTTTRPPLTLCQQQYGSVEKFYDSFPNIESGPPYPACTSSGMYVRRQCNSVTSVCRCVQSEDGETLRGSQFWGPNSAFEIDCDKFGNLDAAISNFRAEHVHTTSVMLMWDPVPGINGYVLVVNDGIDDEKTISINGNSGVYMSTDLLSGNKYNFGIFAVNSRGSAGPISYINITTLFVDTPHHLEVKKLEKNNATIMWEYSSNSDEYEVVLTSSETDEVLRNFTGVLNHFITFNELNSSTLYIVEVRAIAKHYSVEGEDYIIHRSPFAAIEFRLRCELPLLDLIFVLDTSNVNGWKGFQDIKAMFQQIISAPPMINPVSGKRVAAVRYYGMTAGRLFDYNRFSRTSDAARGLGFSSYGGGPRRNITKALNYVSEHFFTSPSMDGYQKRDNSISIVIFFAAGQPSEEIRQAAIKLQQVTNVVAVGVEGYSDNTLLIDIASSPELVVIAPTFAQLRNYGQKVVDTFCYFR